MRNGTWSATVRGYRTTAEYGRLPCAPLRLTIDAPLGATAAELAALFRREALAKGHGEPCAVAYVSLDAIEERADG